MRNYREFKGGYVVSTDVDALLSAKKSKAITKRELRYFFAALEREESGDRVSIDYLLNGCRPKRRVTAGQQQDAERRLYEVLDEHRSPRELSTKIPRIFARAAARGYLDVSQMIAALFYFRWRMRQRRRRKLIYRGERYASFTYERAREVTGLARSTLCKAFQCLRRLKVVAVAWRPMWQIKHIGMLFVDGQAINLFCEKEERYRGSNPWKRPQKKRTQASEKANSTIRTLPKNSFMLRSTVAGAFGAIRELAMRHCPDHVIGTAIYGRDLGIRRE